MGRGGFIFKGLEANEEFFMPQKNGILNHTVLNT
jgi:hypothetical protein